MSLSYGRVLLGTRWDYFIIGSVQGDVSRKPTVFAAKVVPKDGTSEPDLPHLALIKTAPNNRTARENLRGEWKSYLRPPVSSSPSFRKMYELIGKFPDPCDEEIIEEEPDEELEELGFTVVAIGRDKAPIASATIGGAPRETISCAPNPYLALEWLETTLQDVEPILDKHGYILVTAVIETVMTSILALDEAGLFNTDTKPANILINGAGTDHPVVKPDILGIEGNEGGEMFHNPWSIAKLRRLFPNWNGPPVKHDVREVEFRIADKYLSELRPVIRDILPLDEEMQEMGLLPELGDLFRFILVIDPDARPSAAQVLASKQLRALKDAISRMQ